MKMLTIRLAWGLLSRWLCLWRLSRWPGRAGVKEIAARAWDSHCTGPVIRLIKKHGKVRFAVVDFTRP
jgi:hypothetical protein